MEFRFVVRVCACVLLLQTASCGNDDGDDPFTDETEEDSGDTDVMTDGDSADVDSEDGDSDHTDSETMSQLEESTGYWPSLGTDFDTGPFDGESCDIVGAPQSSKPVMVSQVRIDGESFSFKPDEVVTKRPDLFRPGYFSIFDLLVHLKDKGLITMDYRWDGTRDTHIVDKMQDNNSWWYTVYYSGGWAEQSMHRMDYYPVKDHMYISFNTTTSSFLQKRYDAWLTEVNRKAFNNGLVIVPEVIIEMKSTKLTFNDVLVQPHNLRWDFLAPGVVTTADVIQSMAVQGLITCTLEWYDLVANAIVGQYYVEQINEWDHTGHCGFVHESGEKGDSGNHIHIVPDLRIIESPEYVLFYWIELGLC